MYFRNACGHVRVCERLCLCAFVGQCVSVGVCVHVHARVYTMAFARVAARVIFVVRAKTIARFATATCHRRPFSLRGAGSCSIAVSVYAMVSDSCPLPTVWLQLLLHVCQVMCFASYRAFRTDVYHLAVLPHVQVLAVSIILSSRIVLSRDPLRGVRPTTPISRGCSGVS